MAEAERINYVEVEGIGKFPLGGGGGSQPAPDSVGSEEIRDGGVHMEDLDDGVKDGLDELNNISLTDEDIEEIFYGPGGRPQKDASGEGAASGDGAALDGNS